MSDVLYRLSQVRKQYGEALAVDVDALDIRPGETLCLLGPTGAGKSTLLRLLMAVEHSTSGSISFRELPYRPPLETLRTITMVFQRPLLLSGTVRENVEYGLRMRKADPAKVDRYLDRLELTKLAGQRAGTLSGGQTQLVALARALVLEPHVLLLDEPTSNLDPAHVALVERVIQEDWQERRMTIVWATHNLFQAKRVAQRVALMLNGHIVEAAPTNVFFHSPSDPRTRDFVEGKMIY